MRIGWHMLTLRIHIYTYVDTDTMYAMTKISIERIPLYTNTYLAISKQSKTQWPLAECVGCVCVCIEQNMGHRPNIILLFARIFVFFFFVHFLVCCALLSSLHVSFPFLSQSFVRFDSNVCTRRACITQFRFDSANVVAEKGPDRFGFFRLFYLLIYLLLSLVRCVCDIYSVVDWKTSWSECAINDDEPSHNIRLSSEERKRKLYQVHFTLIP